ncbi:MAG: hypothetical protein VYE22_12800 [Myxococcota bacterium]|nr:hypothetical protein [Myxococcota bacterium]
MRTALLTGLLLLCSSSVSAQTEAPEEESAETAEAAATEAGTVEATPEAPAPFPSVRELRRQNAEEAEAEPDFWSTWVPWAAIVAVLAGVGVAIAVDLTTDAPAPDAPPEPARMMLLRF